MFSKSYPRSLACSATGLTACMRPVQDSFSVRQTSWRTQYLMILNQSEHIGYSSFCTKSSCHACAGYNPATGLYDKPAASTQEGLYSPMRSSSGKFDQLKVSFLLLFSLCLCFLPLLLKDKVGHSNVKCQDSLTADNFQQCCIIGCALGDRLLVGDS